jgi:hypothetical protein
MKGKNLKSNSRPQLLSNEKLGLFVDFARRIKSYWKIVSLALNTPLLLVVFAGQGGDQALGNLRASLAANLFSLTF